MDRVESLGNVDTENKHQSGNVYGVGGVAPTMMAGTHGYGFGYFLEIIPLGKVDDGKLKHEVDF